MKTSQIYTAYVSWNKGGKRRPVLIITEEPSSVIVFKITTKYKNKSKEIQKFYFKIFDWKESGLNKPSYIDTINRIRLNKKDVNFKFVGNLSINDEFALTKFINNQKKR